MQQKDRITSEIKMMIAKANGALATSQNKQKTTAYIYVIFSLLALSFFGLFAISPTITTVSELNKQHEEGTEALKKLQEKNQAIRTLNSKFLTVQPDLVLIDKAIPQSPKVSEFTRQLEALTINNNVAVQKIDVGLMELFPAKNSNEPIFSYTFSISVIGDEQGINSFIADLINMERILGIDRLATGNQNNTQSASITGKAYFYKN